MRGGARQDIFTESCKTLDRSFHEKLYSRVGYKKNSPGHHRGWLSEVVQTMDFPSGVMSQFVSRGFLVGDRLHLDMLRHRPLVPHGSHLAGT